MAVNVWTFGHEPNPLLGFERRVGQPADRDFASIRVDNLSNRFDRGCFAGAVGSKEPENLSPRYLKAEALEDLNRGLEESGVEGLLKIFDAELNIGHEDAPR